MSFTASSEWSERREFVERGVRLGLVTCAALFALLSGLLVLRRLSGAFDRSLGGGTLLATMLLAILGVLAFRVALRAAFPAHERGGWVLQGGLTLCLMGFAFSLSLPGSPAWARALLWLTVLLLESAWWLSGGFRHRLRLPSLPRTASEQAVRGDATVASERISPESDLVEELDPDVIQQLTRAVSPDGREVLHGIVRADFTAGERLQQVHIAICPPMQRTPELNAFLVGGPAATVKVAQRESFGIRLEVRLASRPSRAARVTVEFVAESN